MKFHGLKIGTRLGIGFAAILVPMAVTLTSTLRQPGRISDAKSCKRTSKQAWVRYF